MAQQQFSGKFVCEPVALTTRLTGITAGKERPVVTGLFVGNKDSAAVLHLSIEVNNGTTAYTIMDEYELPARGYLNLEFAIPLEEGWSFKVRRQASQSGDAVISYYETAGTAGSRS
jgi:hypothetical protein